MRPALLVALLVACAAEAKSGVAISTFEGSGAAKVQKAIAAKMCRRGFCGGGDGSGSNMLTGKVFVRGGKKLLDVELHDSDGNLILNLRVPATGKGYAKKVNLAVRKALKQVEAEDDAAEEDEKDGEEEDFDMPGAKPKPQPASEPVSRKPAQPASSEGAANEVVYDARQDDKSTDSSSRVVWLAANFRMQSRHLAFSGLEDSRLYVGREAAYMIGASAAVFPFSKAGKSGPGLTASFASTVTSSPTQIAARFLDANLAWGIRLGSAPVWVRPEAGYRWQLMRGTVTTDYHAVRAGVALEAQVWRFTFWANAAYLGVVGNAGELNRVYFPNGRVQAGATAEVGAALNVMGRLDLVFAGSYDVYLHGLNGQAGDEWVARSANDGFLNMTASVRFGI